MLIDLEAQLRTFIETMLKPYPPDQTVLHAIASTTMPRSLRETNIRNWLNLYRVLRYFPAQTSKAVAAVVLDFADQRRSSSLALDKAKINSEFDTLRARLQCILPPGPRSGKIREAISLTSKALWCCYPEDIPIYDDYAVRALQMLSRLWHVPVAKGGSGYAEYLQHWFALYEDLRPVIDQSYVNGYPYRIRVLDQFLWYLGEPKFT